MGSVGAPELGGVVVVGDVAEVSLFMAARHRCAGPDP
jgi:hypothetical protein